MSTVLDAIVAHKREEIAAARRERPEPEIESALATLLVAGRLPALTAVAAAVIVLLATARLVLGQAQLAEILLHGRIRARPVGALAGLDDAVLAEINNRFGRNILRVAVLGRNAH